MPENEEALKATIKYLIETNQELERTLLDLKSELFKKELLVKELLELNEEILKETIDCSSHHQDTRPHHPRYDYAPG